MKTAINIQTSPTPEKSSDSDIPQSASKIAGPFRSESGHTIMWNASDKEDMAKMPDEFNQDFEWLAENQDSSTGSNDLQM